MSNFYSNFYPNDNAIMIWNNQIFYDCASHASLALTLSLVSGQLLNSFHLFCSFVCACDKGFSLESDGKTCTGNHSKILCCSSS